MMSTNSFSRGQMSGTTWAYLTVSVVVAGPGLSRTLRLTGLTTFMMFDLLVRLDFPPGIVDLLHDCPPVPIKLLPLEECPFPFLGRLGHHRFGNPLPLVEGGHRTVFRPVVPRLGREGLAEADGRLALELLAVVGAGGKGSGDRENPPGRLRRKAEVEHHGGR